MKGSLQRKVTDSQDHLVPLSSHAIQLLHNLRPITGDGILVFPSVRHSYRPMSENAIGYLLGSGFIDQSQKMTVTARATVEKKVFGQRS